MSLLQDTLVSSRNGDVHALVLLHLSSGFVHCLSQLCVFTLQLAHMALQLILGRLLGMDFTIESRVKKTETFFFPLKILRYIGIAYFQ